MSLNQKISIMRNLQLWVENVSGPEVAPHGDFGFQLRVCRR